LVVQPAWPQLHIMSGLSEAPSQKVLQNLLSFAAIQTHDGCAHFSDELLAIWNLRRIQRRIISQCAPSYGLPLGVAER
jgi:hypothetical protein